LLRAALYVRVSTEDQAREGFSIEAQLKRLRAYCRARGWEVVREYIDDGYSGREINRPAYRRMMEEKDHWDVVVVLKMDRIHRNSKNFTTMMELLGEWGKEFNSMQESFDTTTAMGRFVMDIIQRIAQLESEQIGERVKMGMAEKARNGDGYLGFGEPYGYRYLAGRLIVNEEEAAVVRRIYSMYLEGSSLQSIANSLNREKIPSKRGGSWSKQAVGKILRNPLYCGYVRWDGIIRKGAHEPIVTEETYMRVQERMEKNVKNRRGITRRKDIPGLVEGSAW